MEKRKNLIRKRIAVPARAPSKSAQKEPYAFIESRRLAGAPLSSPAWDIAAPCVSLIHELLWPSMSPARRARKEKRGDGRATGRCLHRPSRGGADTANIGRRDRYHAGDYSEFRFGVDSLHDVIDRRCAALVGRVIVSAVLAALGKLLFAVHLIPDVSPAVRIVFGRLDA